MFKNFVWDFDGTVVDTYPCILKCYEIIFESYNVKADLNLIADMLIRYSSKETVEFIEKEYHIPKDEFKEKYKKLIYREDITSSIKVLDDCDKICMKIKESGCKNYIITNRDITTITILDMLNIKDLFSDVVYNGLENMTKRKPDIEAFNYLINKYNLNPKETLYIGDRDLDVDTSKKVGFKTCLYRPIEGYKSNPDYIINSFSELEKFLN